MDFSKLLRALLAKVYKKQDTEIDSLLSETDEAKAETTLLDWDRARVSEIQKPKPGSTFQDGYAKAKKEVLEQHEAALKSKYGIDSDTTGQELIDEIVAAKVGEGVKGDVSKLTPEEIKKLPQFQSILREHNSAIKKVNEEAQAKIKEIEQSQVRKETLGTVKGTGEELLNGLNPVLPKELKAASRQKKAFLDSTLDAYEWKNQDGVWLPLNKDGQVATDSHGNALTLEGLVKGSAAEWFEFAANNGGGNAGNGKPGEEGSGGKGTGTYPAGVTKPKTFEELNTVLENQTIKAEDRAIVLKTWEAEQAAGTK